MLRAVRRRFRDALPASPVEWLTDNGSVIPGPVMGLPRSHEKSGWSPEQRRLRSPTRATVSRRLREDDEARLYRMMPKPDSRTAVGNFGDRVRALQRAPPAQRSRVSFPSGISAQSGICNRQRKGVWICGVKSTGLSNTSILNAPLHWGVIWTELIFPSAIRRMKGDCRTG